MKLKAFGPCIAVLVALGCAHKHSYAPPGYVANESLRARLKGIEVADVDHVELSGAFLSSRLNQSTGTSSSQVIRSKVEIANLLKVFRSTSRRKEMHEEPGDREGIYEKVEFHLVGNRAPIAFTPDLQVVDSTYGPEVAKELWKLAPDKEDMPLRLRDGTPVPKAKL